jgi:hypothetical protein
VIPPLFAPNDPKFVEEDRKRTREKKRIQTEFQKRNADIALMDFRVQPSPRSEGTSNEAADDTGPIAVQDDGIVVDGGGENQAGEEEEALEQPAREADAPPEEAVAGDGDGENQAGVDQDADVADHGTNEEEAKVEDVIAGLGDDLAAVVVPNADDVDSGKET